MARSPLECWFCFASVALLMGVGLGGRPAAAQSLVVAHSPVVLKQQEAIRFLVRQPAPQYPVLAKMNYIQGNVRVLATVSEDGNVSEVHAMSGHPFLALAALKAVSNWLFRPARLRNGPAEFMTLVDVHFLLHARKITQMPREPERDLRRQVLPPKLLEQPAAPFHATHVRLRVLVGPDGDAVDSLPIGAGTRLLTKARRIVDGWKFQPARWGALPVPWYLDVDVPVESWPAAQSAADAPGR
jgi:TonB family protein